MGREATITAEQVHAVADALKAEGVKPTARAVRERLGNTGSMGTVTRLLQQWRDGQQRQAASTLMLPPALQRAILEFMELELAAARATLEAELASQRQEAADLAAENERQVETIEAQIALIDTLGIDKAAAEGRAAQLEVDLDAAREEVSRERAAAELARTELAKAQLCLEAMPRLERDLAEVRTALEQERNARVAAEQSAAVFASQKDDLATRLADVAAQGERERAALARERERTEKLASDLADARVAVQTGEARIAQLGRDLEVAQQAATGAQAEAKAAGEQAAELRGRLGQQVAPPARGRKRDDS
jgi:chromosome segregation ATPase